MRRTALIGVPVGNGSREVTCLALGNVNVNQFVAVKFGNTRTRICWVISINENDTDDYLYEIKDCGNSYKFKTKLWEALKNEWDTLEKHDERWLQHRTVEKILRSYEKTVQVKLTAGVYTYEKTGDVKIGEYVAVPFGSTTQIGKVIEVNYDDDTEYPFLLKKCGNSYKTKEEVEINAEALEVLNRILCPEQKEVLDWLAKFRDDIIREPEIMFDVEHKLHNTYITGLQNMNNLFVSIGLYKPNIGEKHWAYEIKTPTTSENYLDRYNTKYYKSKFPTDELKRGEALKWKGYMVEGITNDIKAFFEKINKKYGTNY